MICDDTLTNAAGAVRDTYEYDDFGNDVATSGSTPITTSIVANDTTPSSAFTTYALDTTTHEPIGSRAEIRKRQQTRARAN